MLRGHLICRRAPSRLLNNNFRVGSGLSMRWNSSSSSSDTNISTENNETEKTEIAETKKKSSLLASGSRGVKLPPRDQRFVILSARASSILPRQKPKRITQHKVEFKSDQLDAQLKRLLVFKSEVPQEVVLESIQQLKPTTTSVSEKRYDQLFNDILRAYTAPQLREFVRQYGNSGFLGSKTRKKDLVKYIIINHWNLQKSKDISESSDVIVENTINMSRRDLFIIVSRNGKLPRHWTNSGAKIVILGEEQKIIVRSTADTFEWINASMMKALNNVATKEFDLSALQAIADIDNLPLDKIQRLSDVYIEREGNKLIASSFGAHRIDQAERLILGSSGFTPRQVESYLCDINDENLKQGVYSRVIDDESLSWNHRDLNWSRWRFTRRKIKKEEKDLDSAEINIADIFDTPRKNANSFNNVDKPAHPNFLLFESKSSKCEEIPSDEKSPISESYAKSISKAILTTYDSHQFEKDRLSPIQDNIQSNVTIAATFGYILHDDSGKSERNIKTELIAQPEETRSKTTFMSNIPNISEFSRTLPLHTPFSDETNININMNPDDGIRLDRSGLGQPSLDLSERYFSEEKSPADAIEELFDEPASSSGSRNNSIISDEHSYYVQMKFLPSPLQPDTNGSLDSSTFNKLPPVEMWLEVDENERADKESINIVAVDREAITYASIPHMNADIKFSAAQTRFLDTNQHAIHEFLAKSALDFSGKTRINTPNTLSLVINEGESPVTYMYQTMLYRKQVDLDYHGHILQLASIEGGLVGGHRTEANLVLDTSSSEFNPEDVDNLVRSAMSYLNDIQPQNMILRQGI